MVKTGVRDEALSRVESSNVLATVRKGSSEQRRATSEHRFGNAPLYSNGTLGLADQAVGVGHCQVPLVPRDRRESLFS